MDTRKWDGNRSVNQAWRPRGVSPWARGCALLGLVMALGIGVLPDAAAQTGSGRLYRYKNEQGRVEIANAVPADRAASGYDVLDAATGRLLETVAPQLSPRQLAEKQSRDREAQACRQNIERVQALYGSLQDVDLAAEQAQRTLETRIANLEASLGLEQQRLDAQERDAAQRERTGRLVTPELQAGIERSRSQIGAIQVEITQRREEQETSRSEFAADRILFQGGECQVAPEGG